MSSIKPMCSSPVPLNHAAIGSSNLMMSSSANGSVHSMDKNKHPENHKTICHLYQTSASNTSATTSAFNNTFSIQRTSNTSKIQQANLVDNYGKLNNNNTNGTKDSQIHKPVSLMTHPELQSSEHNNSCSKAMQQQQKSFYQSHHDEQYSATALNRPIVICGPSGSGKSTLLKRLLKEHQSNFAFTVSHTTRKPRKGEQDGREYYFITQDQMKTMIENKEFVEYTEFSGNYYGTSKKAVQDALKTGKIFILEVDIEGVKTLNSNKSSELDPLFIFIKPPSKQMLIQRLSSRGTESEASLKKRLDRADEEIEFADNGNVKFDLVLVNDDLEQTYHNLKSFLKIDE